MGYHNIHNQKLEFYQKKYGIDSFEDVATFGYYKQNYFYNVTNFDIENPTGTETIHDLNTPIPFKYHDKFNLVIDGGTLEHIFNIPQCLENISNILKIDGVIYHINPQNGYPDHGLYQFSSDFYYSYYRANKFQNLYHDTLAQDNRIYNCFIAQKGNVVVNTRQIIQTEYIKRYEK